MQYLKEIIPVVHYMLFAFLSFFSSAMYLVCWSVCLALVVQYVGISLHCLSVCAYRDSSLHLSTSMLKD